MFTLSVNGQNHTVDVPEGTPLLWVLRDVIGLTGTKYGCGIEKCWACTVWLQWRSEKIVRHRCQRSRRPKGDDHRGLSPDPDNPSHPLQLAWIEGQVPQCGYCQSGMLMAAPRAWQPMADAPMKSSTNSKTSVSAEPTSASKKRSLEFGQPQGMDSMTTKTITKTITQPGAEPALGRRSFLINTSASIGALVLGFKLPLLSRAEAATGAARRPACLCAYRRRREASPSLYGGSELGQGSMSGLRKSSPRTQGQLAGRQDRASRLHRQLASAI